MKSAGLDAKREEFRKYLEKEGVLEYLTKHLVPLYEKSDKPTSALEYLKNNFAGREVEEAKLKTEALQKENQELKQTVDRLEAEKTSLMSKIAGLEDDLKEARENVKANIDEKMDENEIDTTGKPTLPAESSELDKKSSEETVKE